MKYISINDNEYPEKLRSIYDSPKGLYAEGNISLLNSTAVAIIGSRNCSKYGETVARNFARELAKRDIVIVSGMAKGIDTFAHTRMYRRERQNNSSIRIRI